MRKALVIGIDEYPTAPLRGCVNDANSIASVLEKNGDGALNFSVRVLTAPADVLNKAILRDAIEELFDGDSDVCLFYFSGHGVVTSTGGYIVTPDAKQYDEGVAMDEILEIANQSKTKDKVVLLDCCHSGALGSPAIVGGKIAMLGEGVSVLAASRPYESAIEIKGRGVFTSLVVDALVGGAADLRGYVTPASIYTYIDQRLGAWDQRPIFKTNVSHFTSLRSMAPTVPLPFEILRKLPTYFPAPQYEYSLDPSYEFTSEHAKVTNVAIMKDLQKLVSVGLVVPVGAEHMYFAAMNSMSCKLTPLGQQYWKLAKEGMI